LATVDGIVPLATTASWLIDVVNAAIGALDSPGGVMWPLPAAGGPNTEGTPGRGRGVRIPGSRRTRVRGLASALGEFPVSALAEEIDTPSDDGAGVRALVTVAGNPVLSTPNGPRLAAALGRLDFMLSVDAYLNETTRCADVVLPSPSPLTRPHFDVVFDHLAVRNQARYAPAALPLAPGERSEADTLLELTAIAIGIATGEEPDPDAVDDLVAMTLARQAAQDEASPSAGASPEAMLAAVSQRRRVERLLDLRLRSGPYGDGFGRRPDGLSLAVLEAAPDGIDLGPLQPRLPEILRTPSGRIDLAPPVLLESLDAARALLGCAPADGHLLLVGRRQLRSNNSWMHTIPSLQGGSNACTVLMNPADAERLGIADGQEITLTTPTGRATAPAAVTDAVMPGVVSMPHGWSDGNVNALVGADAIDPLSATSVLAGIPVACSPA
jgi:anaerobic selenocysteine-containing dehydrogenase